jgi:hypothetical protein
MYESIRTLYNVEPPVVEDEVRAAALEYVRRIAGFHRPAPVNAAAVDRAVEEIAAASKNLFESLIATAPARRRDLESSRAYIDWVPVYGSGE